MSMQWTPEAEEAMRKVPFFVRKRVRARVEDEAGKAGKSLVRLADVEATRKRYLAGMASEIKGYQLDMCFGAGGCPNRIPLPDNTMAERIEERLQAADLIGFLKSRGIRDLKFHHEFRVSLADCPNGCSQPQIKDFGIIAALVPREGEAACNACNACVDTCREEAVRIDSDQTAPMIHRERCVACGQCISVCPGGALVEGRRGYRVQLGGKLGRHPRLARELPGIYDADTVLDILSTCLQLYKNKSKHGERFGELLQSDDYQMLSERFASCALKQRARFDQD